MAGAKLCLGMQRIETRSRMLSLVALYARVTKLGAFGSHLGLLWWVSLPVDGILEPSPHPPLGCALSVARRQDTSCRSHGGSSEAE